MKFREYLYKTWREGVQIDEENIFAAWFLGGGSHIALYFIYTYILPMPYESLALRLYCAFMCISTYFLYKYLPEKIRRIYFPFYWQVMIMSALTFCTTFLLLKNNFHEVYLYWEIVVVMIMAVYVPNWLIFLINLTVSISCAILLFILTTPYAILDPQFDVERYLMIFLFANVAGVAFVHSNKSTWLKRQSEQYKRLTALAGSIVHEVRNPLNSISLSARQIRELSHNLEKANTEKEISSVLDSLFNSIKSSNDIIDMTLRQLKDQEISKEDFTNLSIKEVINRAVESYGYKNIEEKNRVKVNLREDFEFRGDETMFFYIVFNLLKNSLYYAKEYPDITITITSREIDGANIVEIKDTGPGIPEGKLESIFDSFETSGKKEGTGLGLSFCRRAMESFGGKIKCESELGKWTKFVLTFPSMAQENQISAQDRTRDLKKSILLYDDCGFGVQMSSMLLNQSNWNDLDIDIVDNNRDIIKAIRSKAVLKKKYDLIILDKEVVDIAGKLREIDNNVPIISYCKSYSINKKEYFKSNIDEYVAKINPNQDLIRIFDKWILNDLNQKEGVEMNKEQIIEALRGKKVLLAEDDKINAKILSKTLENSGIEVQAFNNAQDLLEKYKGQFRSSKSKVNHYVIISDINMPGMNGDELAKEIRGFEFVNEIRDPSIIVGYSGDGDKDNIHKLKRSGIDAFFIKGRDGLELLRTLAYWMKIGFKVG